ncbi:MAG: glycoside hydrolase family 65 protein [Bacteroidota bacterium]
MKRTTIFLLSIFCFSLISGQDFSQSPWHLVADEINPNEYYGVTVANGMIGLVSSPEPMKVADVVLNGVFDTYGRGRVSNIQRGFNFADVNLAINDVRISRETISNFKQVLNMQQGELISSFDLNEEASITYTIRALRHLPFTSMIDVEVRAKKDLKVWAENELRAPDMLRDPHNYFNVIDRPHVTIPLMTSVAHTPTGRHKVAASSSYLFGVEHGQEPRIVHEEWDYNMHRVHFEEKVAAGETYRFTIVNSECSSEHYADPHNEAERLSIYAMLEGRERLLKRHYAAWEKLWESGDIIVEGDLRSQKAIRSALYHLYSFAREGQAYSMSPMGLSGLGYNGHVFWDTELWMFPPIAMLQPEMARSLLEYRFERLEPARQNARSHGYRGAMFPWESDGDGQEATPVWALTGPFEHHISGCIAVACWEYYRITQDKEWLETRGYPIMREVADFWVSRVEKDEQGVCHIYNVVGADEWAENVDDNAFTNGVAKAALGYATAAATVLDKTADPAWTETAKCIPILKLPNGATSEYAGYVDTTVKQADVNLLSYPLEIITKKADIKKDLEFYEPRLSKTGPAMGNAVLSILYSRLGNRQKAWELFEKSYQPNEVPPFGVLSECLGCTNPYFGTGAGGFLQAVINGFAGLEATDEGVIQLKTKLPKNWTSLTIKGVGPEDKVFKIE